MSSETDAQGPATAQPSVTNTLGTNWKWLLAGGVVIAILGVIALFAPFASGMSVTFLIGFLLIAGGIIHFFGAFNGQGWAGFGWQILLGLVSIVAGGILLLNPVFGLVTLTLLVIAYLFVSGIVEIVMAISLRGEQNWVVSIISGAIGILLAVMLWAGFPSTAAWAVGVLFGAYLLVRGIAMVVLALGARSALKSAEFEQPAGAGGV